MKRTWETLDASGVFYYNTGQAGKAVKMFQAAIKKSDTINPTLVLHLVSTLHSGTTFMEYLLLQL